MTKKKRKPALITRRKGTVTITENGRALIEAMATEGQDERTIARALGISQRTLVRCRDRDEEVEEAWADGHAQLADELTHILLGHARGEGKAAIIAAIYLTKARLGWTDQPQPEERAPAVVIHLPDARSPEDYMKMIEHQPQLQLPAPEKVPDVLSRPVTR
ncbi:MAG: hypothetical protein V3U93_03485 [Alphaproteobacteria bacterium]